MHFSSTSRKARRRTNGFYQRRHARHDRHPRTKIWNILFRLDRSIYRRIARRKLHKICNLYRQSFASFSSLSWARVNGHLSRSYGTQFSELYSSEKANIAPLSKGKPNFLNKAMHMAANSVSIGWTISHLVSTNRHRNQSPCEGTISGTVGIFSQEEHLLIRSPWLLKAH